MPSFSMLYPYIKISCHNIHGLACMLLDNCIENIRQLIILTVCDIRDHHFFFGNSPFIPSTTALHWGALRLHHRPWHISSCQDRQRLFVQGSTLHERSALMALFSAHLYVYTLPQAFARSLGKNHGVNAWGQWGQTCLLQFAEFWRSWAMLHLCKVEHDPVLTLTDPLGRKDMSFNYFRKK